MLKITSLESGVASAAIKYIIERDGAPRMHRRACAALARTPGRRLLLEAVRSGRHAVRRLPGHADARSARDRLKRDLSHLGRQQGCAFWLFVLVWRALLCRTAHRSGRIRSQYQTSRALAAHAHQALKKRTPATGAAVAAGRIDMAVSFMDTPIYDEVDDLCAQTACPIAPGALEVEYVKDLPPIAPPASVVLRVCCVFGCVFGGVHVCVFAAPYLCACNSLHTYHLNTHTHTTTHTHKQTKKTKRASTTCS